MINLSGKFRYYLCTDNVTLRFRHRGLREYIKGKLHRDPCNGDVYIFLSRDLSRLRVYYFHHNGEILTEKILHAHRFTHPIFLDEGKHVYHISWSMHVRPIFEMKWRPRAFSRVSTGDSDILSSCDMNDEHA